MWLNDFRIVTADRVIEHGALRIDGGAIAEITSAPVAEAAINGQNMLLLPGFIDMHGDMIEREVEPRPDVRMPMELGLADLDRKLAGAGVTTAYAAVSFSPTSGYGHLRSYPHTTEMIRALKAANPRLSIDHRIHARFEVTFPAALSVVQELVAEGLVDLLSLTDHTPGQGQYRDMERYVQVMARSRNLSEEEARVAVQGRINERSQPAEVLTQTLRAVCDLCAEKGVAIASHDDDSPEKVALMAGFGAVVSEFPVTLDAARAAHRHGMMTAMGAPNALRGQSYSGNLSARATHAEGLLDILAADYHPSAVLPALLILAADVGLPAAVALATANPARALGLTDRGQIASGRRADLVLADDDGIGRVRATYVAGRAVYSDGFAGESHLESD
ncbi:MAG: alpha-D-ribose 1-methylphosphonate 5-triphosphate diphosphatase [Devosia sp.]